MVLTVALSNALSGLNAQTRCISNISNNLANTSTTSYKACSTMFEDLVPASTGSNTGGAASYTRYHNGRQGNLQTVSSDTYMAISGSGYFPVSSATVVDDGTTATVTVGDETLYTRAGDFSLNAYGYMANQEGYYLMGWAVDPDTGAVATGTLVPVQLSEFIDQPVATTEVTYEANLPADGDVGLSPSASSKTIYDDTIPDELHPHSDEHDLTYQWTKTGTNTWDLSITAADGLGAGTDYTATLTFNFDTTGHIASIDDNGSAVTIDGTSVSFGLAFENATPQTVTCSFDGMTQFADQQNFTLSAFDQNGVPPGSFSKVGIDENGFVSIVYDNGQSSRFYQIPIATFLGEDYLDRAPGNAYRTTDSSGLASYSAPGTGGAGKIATNALENSTVDIAQEFTNMIAAQQAYSANARTISVADTMLQTLVNLSA